MKSFEVLRYEGYFDQLAEELGEIFEESMEELDEIFFDFIKEMESYADKMVKYNHDVKLRDSPKEGVGNLQEGTNKAIETEDVTKPTEREAAANLNQ